MLSDPIFRRISPEVDCGNVIGIFFGVSIIWFITRPMFALIGYGWHIIVPLTPFVFDPDLFDSFPGQYVNRKRLEIRRNDPRNNIILTPKNIPMTFPQSTSGEIRRKIGSDNIPPNHPGSSSDGNTSTSNSKTSTMGSSASATDSTSHIHSVNSMVSENNDQETERKGQMTWTQFDEVDIDSREYNNKLYYTVEM
jgi:hypothetical protein